MMDVLDGAGKDSAFSLLARPIGYDTSKLIDTLIDIASASAFYFFLSCVPINKLRKQKTKKETCMIILALPTPLVTSHRCAPASPSRCTTRSTLCVRRTVASTGDMKVIFTSFFHLLRLTKTWCRGGAHRHCQCRKLAKVGRAPRMGRWARVVYAGKLSRIGVLTSLIRGLGEVGECLCSIFFGVSWFVDLIKGVNVEQGE